MRVKLETTDPMSMPATLLSPYIETPGAVWLRGNLHAHTTRSDGACAPQEVIDAYARLGYDFLALSDHDVAADYSGLDARGMILLPCSEVSARGGHVLAVGCRSRIEPDPDRQKVIDAIRAAGGMPVICHPNWEEDFNHYTYEDLACLTGYAGVEVYNEQAGSVLSSDKWDRVLALRRPVWGFAHDDTHALAQAGRAWNVVLSGERTAEAVLSGLSAGSFYASSGVTVSRIAVEGPRLIVTAPAAEGIAAIGELGRRLAWVEGPELVFDATDCRTDTFRVECFGRAGRMAWTQSFRVSSPELDLRRRLLSTLPVLRVGRAARAPKLTGDLRAAAWRSAGATTRFVDSVSGVEPPVATEFRVLAAGRKLLFGFRCEEPDPGGMRLSVQADGDSRLWTDDSVEVFIDPEGRGRSYLHVMANAAGFVYAVQRCRNVPGGEARVVRQRRRAARGARGWTLELELDLRDLGARPVPGESWRFNACRNRYAGSRSRRMTWSFTGSGNHTPVRFGVLEF